MEKLFVEFTDSTASKINSVFGCQQHDEQFPNQGVVLADARGGKSTFLGAGYCCGFVSQAGVTPN